MDKLVVTLETAKKLKATGLPQVSAFAWVEGEVVPGYDGGYGTPTDEHYAALTAQELSDQLPKRLPNDGGALAIWHDGFTWIAQYDRDENEAPIHEFLGKTMAQALATLWLKLHEVQQ